MKRFALILAAGSLAALSVAAGAQTMGAPDESGMGQQPQGVQPGNMNGTEPGQPANGAQSTQPGQPHYYGRAQTRNSNNADSSYGPPSNGSSQSGAGSNDWNTNRQMGPNGIYKGQ